MKIFKASMLASVVLFGATAANAECRLDTFVVSDGQVFTDYDPFEAVANPIALPLRSSGTPDCTDQRVRLGIEPDPSSPFSVDGAIRLESGGSTLDAVIANTSGRAATSRLSSGGAPSAVLRLGSGGEVRDGDLYLQLPAGQRVPPGIYRARLVVVASPLQRDGSEGEAVRSAFDVSVRVMPSVGLAAGSDTTLDLGTIESGATAQTPVSFRAYANTGYQLRISSDHNFNLALNGQSDGPRIAYVPTLGGQDIVRGNRQVDFRDPGSSGYRQHQLNVRVPTLERRPAGTYRDYITVEISAIVGG